MNKIIVQRIKISEKFSIPSEDKCPPMRPANKLPKAVDANHKPIICPRIDRGDNCVTADNPTGLKHNSPKVIKKIIKTNHSGEIN